MSFWGFIKSIGNTIKSAITSLVEEKVNQIKVNKIEEVSRFVFDVNDDKEQPLITLKESAQFQLDIERYACIGKKWKWRNAKLYVKFDKGFKTNGTSAPRVFHMNFPPYIDMNEENAGIYNAAAFIHDGLYACKGEIQEKDVPKEKNESVRYTLARRECDNLLREIWIKSKFVDSLSAKIAEFGVNVVAKGPEHWDNDDLHCKEHFNVTIEYL